MLRQLIDKEVALAKDVVHVLREWIHPTKAMKNAEFDRPLDDLGQTIDDVEHRAEPQDMTPPRHPPRA